MTYTVTGVDKFHGPCRESLGKAEVQADILRHNPDYRAALRYLGHALRCAGVLVTGQRVLDFRFEGDTIIVFPMNAPGLTTGLHSVTLTPEVPRCPTCGYVNPPADHTARWCPNQ